MYNMNKKSTFVGMFILKTRDRDRGVIIRKLNQKCVNSYWFPNKRSQNNLYFLHPFVQESSTAQVAACVRFMCHLSDT